MDPGSVTGREGVAISAAADVAHRNRAAVAKSFTMSPDGLRATMAVGLDLVEAHVSVGIDEDGRSVGLPLTGT